MRYIILYTLILLSFNLYAQEGFRGEYTISSSNTPTIGTYGTVGFFSDSDGLGYASSDIKVDTTIFRDNRGFRYLVVKKTGVSPLYLEFNAIDSSVTPLSGKGQLYDATTNYNFPLETGGVNEKNRASSTTHFREQLDSLLKVIQDSTSISSLDSLLVDGTLTKVANTLKVDTTIIATQYDLTLISTGLDTVSHNLTLTGQGTVSSLLEVDTSQIATQYDLTTITTTVIVDGTLSKSGDTIRVDTAQIATQYDLTLVPTLFTNSTFAAPSTILLYEEAFGSYSTRFRSPSTLAYMGIVSDTADTEFIGLTWNTLGGNAAIGHRLGGYYLEFGDDLIINSTNSLDRAYLQYTTDTDNSNTKVLAKDPITGELEEVDISSTIDVDIDNIGTGDTLSFGKIGTLIRVKSLLSGSNITLTAADSTISIEGEAPLYKADQYITADRLVSGSDTYDFKLDSVPLLNIHADEYFITDEETNVIDWLSTTNRYLKKNAGLMRINSLGQDYTILQNTDGVDQLNFVWASDSEIKIGSVEKEVVGVAATGPDITLTPTASTWSYEDSLSGVRGRILMNGSTIKLSGTDTLVIDMDGVTVDNNVDTLLAISESGRIYKKSVVSVGGGVSYDDYTSGTVVSSVVRIGGISSTISNPATGQYSFVVNSSGYVQAIDIQGNNANLDGSNQLTLTIDNSTNSRDRLFNIQMIDLNSNSQVNAFVTGTNYTQSTFGNITTIVFSNMNGFGAAGYKIMLR